MPMHEVVLSNFHIRRLRSLRRPSFAGNGLPERMRSTAFAFLGLTAALGLALVAIFAQLSFPVLAPAPPPVGPAGKSGVSTSLALGRGPAGPAQQAALLSGAVPAGLGGGGSGGADPAGRGDGRVGGVGSSVSAEKPGNAVEPNDEGVQPEPSPPPVTPAPTGNEAASAEATPAAAPIPIPTSPSPSPVTSAPKPEPNEEKPEPTEPESKPGRNHGGKPPEEAPKPEEKPVKEPKPPKAEAPPAPAPVPPPAPEAPAEKGNSGKSKGKALGHYK